MAAQENKQPILINRSDVMQNLQYMIEHRTGLNETERKTLEFALLYIKALEKTAYV